VKKWMIALFSALVFTGCGAEAASSQAVLPVEFKPLVNRQEVLPISQEQVKNVYTKKDIDKGQVILFSRPYEQDDLLYAAWVKDGKLYDLGAVGTKTFADMAYIHRHEFNGHTVIRIDGVYAAKALQSNYYLLEDGAVKPFLRVNGHVVEADLDRDGKKEIITTHGLKGLTKIYRETPDDQFEAANINEATGAKEVVFQMEDDLFIAGYDGYKRQFLYTKDGLREER
jgi:hypothetical protein